VEISLLTAKCTLVPSNFFAESSAREALSEVAVLKENETVSSVGIPWYGAELVYCDSSDDSVSKTITDDSAGSVTTRPESYFILRDLPKCRDYNKILASFRDGMLYLGIAQGGSLLLSNVFHAPDFTTAEYFIFLAMKSLQLNPEVSTICFRHALDQEQEMSLYRYFKAVETL